MYNETIEPEMQSIICPKFFSTSIHNVVCPKMFDSNIIISSPLLRSSYADTKLHWQHLLKKLQIHLGDGEVFFVGDSLKLLTIAQLRCLEDFTAVSILNHASFS